MKKYITLNSKQTCIHYNSPKTIYIHASLLLDSLSKRQIEMINNNDKNKFLKSLKHLTFATDGIEEIEEVLNNNTYIFNNIILTKNNIQKELIKHWEKQITPLKTLTNLTLNDFICYEFLTFDKSGIVTPIDTTTGSSQQLKIQAIYGECPNEKNLFDLEFDLYILDKNNNSIDKDISKKTFYYSNKEGNFFKENIPEKKSLAQILPDTDIYKLLQISNEINTEYNSYKTFTFGITNNKIYIFNLIDVEIDINFKNHIKWDNSFTTIKNKTTHLNFSIQDILYNTYINTLSDIFFTYPSKHQHLLFYNNFIYNKSNIISDLLLSSGVYLYSPSKFRDTFHKIYDLPQSNEEDFDNKIYLLEYIRCFLKLYKEYTLLDYNINNSIEQLHSIEEKITEITDFNISILLRELETSIALLKDITKFNIYNMLISCCSKNNGMLENKLFTLYSNATTEVDKKIFTQTYQNSYYTSFDLSRKDNILFNDNCNEVCINEIRPSHFQQKCLIREENLFVLKNKCIGIIKKIIKEISIKYTLLKEFDSADDIYFLLIDEILNYNYKVLTNYKELIKNRKNDFLNNHKVFSKIQIPEEVFSSNIQPTYTENKEDYLDESIHGQIIINNISENMSDKILIISELNMNYIFAQPKMIIFEPNFDTEYFKSIMTQLNIPYLEIANATSIFAHLDGKII